jgi:hypothetical protein
MYQERIRANPTWRGNRRFDTVFVTVSDDERSVMNGMLVARVFLFFLFHDPKLQKEIPCVLVNWFVPVSQEPDHVTGMWVVKPEILGGKPTVEVIHLDSIVQGAHLIPQYGTGFLPEDFSCIDALDSFKSYFVNHFIDYHAHELLQ